MMKDGGRDLEGRSWRKGVGESSKNAEKLMTSYVNDPLLAIDRISFGR